MFTTPPLRVAIIGTGELAMNLALDLGRHQEGGVRVVAFFDDNPRSWNRRPHDIPVVGMPECIQRAGLQHALFQPAQAALGIARIAE